MKKFLVLLGLVATSLFLVGCADESGAGSSDTSEDATSTRYKEVSILEGTSGVSDGWKNGGIEIIIQSYSSNAMVYAMVVEHGQPAPTESQIAAGKKYSTSDIVGAYNAKATLYEFVDDSILTQGDSYDCYAVIKNAGNYSTVYKSTCHTFTHDQLEDKGSGTITDPFQVYTIEDLKLVGYATVMSPDAEYAHYKLMNNIDLSKEYNEEEALANSTDSTHLGIVEGRGSWLSLTYQSGTRKKFRGVFDGQGYTINGLYQYTSKEGAGLFGELDEAGTIKNVVLTNVNIHSVNSKTAAICGYSKGFISKCVVLGGTVSSTYGRLGGIVGHLYQVGDVFGCYVDANVLCESPASTSNAHIGGIVGHAYDGSVSVSITRCQFTGSVQAGGSFNTGGIVGRVEGAFVENNIVNDAYLKTSSSSVGAIIGAINSYNYVKPDIKNNVAANITCSRSYNPISASSGNATFDNNAYTSLSGSLNSSTSSATKYDSVAELFDAYIAYFPTALYSYDSEYVKNGVPMLIVGVNGSELKDYYDELNGGDA